MSQMTKHRSLLLLGGVLISFVLLSGSLSNLELQAGSFFPGVDSNYVARQAASEQIQTYSFTALPGILGLILLLLIVYVLIRLIAFVNLKWLLRWLFRFILALSILFILLVILSYLNFGPTGASEWILEIAPSSSVGISTSPLERPPMEWIWFVAIGFILATIWFIVRILGRQAQPSHEDSVLCQAKSAMEALQAGKDFKNTIIRCYLEMTNALQQERGIERNHDMTAREFRDWLELKGWPRVPVEKLTDLFERVRYGQQDFGENDEKIALDSLNEIIQFVEGKQDEVFTE